VGANQSQGSAYVYVLEGGHWIERQKLAASDGEEYENFGASVALSGNTIAVAAPSERPLPRDPRGAVYIYEREGTGWTERQKLVRPEDFTPSIFGCSVSVAGNTLVVGASSPPGAYVYVRQGTTWFEQQQLVGTGDQDYTFGSSVSISGDTILVGAPMADSYVGAAHVFVRSGTTWTEQRKLLPASGAVNTAFGGTVAVSGNTALVSAAGENAQRGAVYFYVREGSDWSLQQKIVGAAENAWFGLAAALDADTAIAVTDVSIAPGYAHDIQIFERSGTSWSRTHVISRYGNQKPFPHQMVASLSGDALLVAGTQNSLGHAQTYARTQGTWVEQQSLTTRDVTGFNRLGTSVTLSDDKAAVSAFAEEAIYTYERSGSRWLESQRIAVSGTFPESASDKPVAMSGDGLAIGTPHNNGISIYRRSAGSWVFERLISGLDSRASGFGTAVAMDGDLVAATGYPTDSTDQQGAVYLFGRNGAPRALLVPVAAPSARQEFGGFLALSGDTVLVGAAPRSDGSSSTALGYGAAYVYVRDGVSWKLQQKLTASDGRQWDGFGERVALKGDTAIVTAPQASASNAAGAAYVFVRQGTTWAEQQKLSATTQPNPPISNFGLAVSLDGDTAVVSARGNPLVSEGQIATYNAAYVFTRSGATWTEQLVFRARNEGVNDAFAAAAAIHGSQLLLGAPNTAGPAPYGKPQEGRAYFYDVSGLRGMACTVGDECASGHCVDGFCCDTACTGQCEWCGDSASPGVCKANPAGAPRGSRAACNGEPACAGQCDGTKRDSCVAVPAKTECAPAMCSGDKRIPASACDGAGICTPGALEDCGSYTCDVNAAECKRDCSRDPDCRAGFTCIDGRCDASDSGTGEDSGEDGARGTAPSDAGSTLDADNGDAADLGDAKNDSGPMPPDVELAPADDDGCGCRMGAERETGGLGVVLGFLLAVCTRRRRSGAPRSNSPRTPTAAPARCQ
jgi:hypothetical protein